MIEHQQCPGWMAMCSRWKRELERHGVESPENLEAQDHLINDHQTQVSEHVGASDDENERRAMNFERDRRTLEVDVHG